MYVQSQIYFLPSFRQDSFCILKKLSVWEMTSVVVVTLLITELNMKHLFCALSATCNFYGSLFKAKFLKVVCLIEKIREESWSGTSNYSQIMIH